MTESCLKYPGGKGRLLKHIMAKIPRHSKYVEPFAGGLAVLLAKQRSETEVINDLSSEVSNFYRYVKWHYNALVDEMDWYLHSRDNFLMLRKNPGATELQRAARWFLLNVCSFSGYGDYFGRNRSKYHGFDPQRHYKKIKSVHSRLRNVYIENLDFEAVCEFYDSPDAFHYFDPPYITSDAGNTYDKFTKEDMMRVRSVIDNLKGKWMLSCDDSEECREVFKGYPKTRISIKYSSGTNEGIGEKPVSYELLVQHPSIKRMNKNTLL